MRERFVRIGAAIAIIAGASFGSGCVEQSKQAIPTPAGQAAGPNPPEKTPIIISAEKWRMLPPLQKIQDIEFIRYPNTPDFDPIKELVSAAAQFYCEQTRCKKDPGQMANNVFFMTPQQFVEKVEKDQGRAFTEIEKAAFLNRVPEATNVRTNQVFVNNMYIERYSELLQAQPQLVRELGGRDTSTVFRKSVLLHAYSHLNQSDESFSFEPLMIQSPGEAEPITIDQIERFVIRGRRQDGQETFLGGGVEAMVDLAARIIGKASGGYLATSPNYEGGVVLLAMLNEKSNVSEQEFLEYANGTRPFKDLLRKWGSIKNRVSPDEQAAILAYITIGVRVQGGYTQAETIQRIEGLLESKLRQ